MRVLLRSRLREPGTVSAAVLLVSLVISVGFLHAGGGTLIDGAVFGCGTALAALGLCLVHRTSRIVNFAQIQVGAVSAVLFTEVVRHRTLLGALSSACATCLPDGVDAAPAGLVAANYWIAAVVALVLGPVISLVLLVVVVRPLARAPRLVPTVATIGAGLVLVWAAGRITEAFNPSAAQAGPGLAADTRPPEHVSIALSGTVLNLGSLLTIGVTVVALGGLIAWLRLSRIGAAVRATADNEERAQSLGIGPIAVQSVVWAVAGLLSAAGAELANMSSGTGGSGGVTPQLLVAALAAAVIAGFETLPVAVLAALVIGVLQQAVLGANLDPGIRDLVTLGMILAVLTLRPRDLLTRVAAASGQLQAREVRPIPAELRGLAVVRRMRRGVLVVALLATVAVPFTLSPESVTQASQLLLDGIVGMSLLVLSGWAGQVSLGQFAIAGVGAWVTATLAGSHGVPWPIALALAAAAGAVSALLLGLPALRIRGLYLAVATFGFAQAAQTVLFGQQFGARTLPTRLERFSLLGIDTNDERVFYWTCLTATILVVLGVTGIRRSRSGRALIASRDNEQAIQAFGVNLVRARLQAFAVSGTIAAFAGGLYAYSLGTLDSGTFSPAFSEDLLLMAVLGGLGFIGGPLLGVLYLALVTAFLGGGSAGDAAIGAGVVVLLLLAPGGITQLVFGVRDAVLRRIAEQRGIVVPSLVADVRVDPDGRVRVPISPRLGDSGIPADVPRRYRLARPTPTATEGGA